MNESKSLNCELENETLLTTKQFAALLDCQPNTIDHSRCSGKLFGLPAPVYIKLGEHGRVFYRQSTAKKFKAQILKNENPHTTAQKVAA